MSDQLQSLLAGLSGEQLTKLIQELGIKVPEAEKQQRAKPKSEHGPCKRPAVINLTVNCNCGNRYTTSRETLNFTPLYNQTQSGAIRVTPVNPGSVVSVETWTKSCPDCPRRIKLMSREELEARYLTLAESCNLGGAKKWV